VKISLVAAAVQRFWADAAEYEADRSHRRRQGRSQGHLKVTTAFAVWPSQSCEWGFTEWLAEVTGRLVQGHVKVTAAPSVWLD